VREPRTQAEAFMLRSDKTELSAGGIAGSYAANLQAILFFLNGGWVGFFGMV